MELPLSLSQTAATERTHEPNSNFTSPPEADSRNQNTSPILDKHPALRQKISRLPLRLFGTRNKKVESPSEGAITLASEPLSDQHDTAYPLPSVRPLNTPRRRPEIRAWVREPARKRHASNNSVRKSYRKAFKDPLVRKHTITSVILGILLVTMISLYLAFVLAFNTLEGQEFHVMIILFIIILAILFCHSLARTCMLATRVARYGTTFHRVPSVVGPRGYAQPAEPIRVILARDEEIAGQDQNIPQAKLRAPPPAYGLWRNSVRIDPNLIHWQRVQEAKAREGNRSETPRPTTANRPPSYASDNGVDYVIEAQPRSTVSHHNGHER